jgi:hypothetical protein
MIIILIIVFLFCGSIHAQTPISVGERGSIVIADITKDSSRYELTLSNSSVFYIDSISIGSITQEIQRITHDSIAWFGNGLGTLEIHGLALAGSDSMTMLHINGIHEDALTLDTMITIRIASSNTPLPYIRLSTLSDNIPNPVMRGEPTEWTFTLDTYGSVTISIITLDGRILEEFSAFYEKGQHIFRFIPNTYFYHPGVYGIRLKTDQGIIHKLWNVSP